MALHWDVGRVANWNNLVRLPSGMGEGSERTHPVTETLVFATMAIGMNEITSKNWIEFYQRLRAVERVTGPTLWRHMDLPKYDERNYITPLEVYMHIGLHTNASSMSLAKFREHLYFLSCKETHYSVFDKVPSEYDRLGIITISKEDWVNLWMNGDREQYTTDALMEHHLQAKQKEETETSVS